MNEHEREEKILWCIENGFDTFIAMQGQGCSSDDERGRKLDRCLQRMRKAERIGFVKGKWVRARGRK
jgi:hypothetical protein